MMESEIDDIATLLKKQDAEIARLRAAHKTEQMRAEKIAADRDDLRTERDAAREALEYYAQSIRDRIVDDGERARAALSSLSSPGAQQTNKE